jgi:hypothetical protein
MTAFQKAEALAGRRYDPRQAALAGSRGHNAVPHAESLRTIEDADTLSILGQCSRSLERINPQQYWSDFEKKFWPKAGVDRRGSKRGTGISTASTLR